MTDSCIARYHHSLGGDYPSVVSLGQRNPALSGRDRCEDEGPVATAGPSLIS